MDNATKPRTDADFNAAIFALACVIFLIPLFVAPLTYPAYYEDESWIHLAIFEAVRGNGLTLAALNEGPTSSLVFGALVAGPIAGSPLSPELTVRILHTLASLGVIAAAYLVARKLAPQGAAFAAALIVAAPFTYLTLRYGRVEALALTAGLLSIASALHGRMAVAGVLSGIAVCIHPILVWTGLPCLLIAVSRRDWPGLARYVVAGAIAVTPQLVWSLQVAQISENYLVTSSVSATRFAVLESIINEPARYSAYVSGLGAPDLLIQSVFLLGFALAGLVMARGWTRWTLVSITLAPLAALAMFSQGKNPYYFVTALPALAVTAAYAAARLPHQAALGTSAILLIYVACVNAPAAWQTRSEPQASAVTAALAHELPQGAIVFAPLRYAGLVRSRADIRFFSYHALSEPGPFQLPSCDAMGAHIAALVARDPRATSAGAAPNEVHFAMYGFSWEQYLDYIYERPDDALLQCLLGSDIRTLDICQPGGACQALEIARRPLSPG